MKLRLLQGGVRQDDTASIEMMEFERLLKIYLLKAQKSGKVIDTSCFYNIECEDLAKLVNKVGGC